MPGRQLLHPATLSGQPGFLLHASLRSREPCSSTGRHPTRYRRTRTRIPTTSSIRAERVRGLTGLDIRLDHNISDRFKVWGRGSYKVNESTPFNGFGNIATSIGSSTSHNDSYAETDGDRRLYAESERGIFRRHSMALPASRSKAMRSRGLRHPHHRVPAIYVRRGGLTQGWSSCLTLNVNSVSKLGQATFTTLLQAPSSHNVRST